jgi:hypothetical protein
MIVCACLNGPAKLTFAYRIDVCSVENDLKKAVSSVYITNKALINMTCMMQVKTDDDIFLLFRLFRL